jgi:SAM-dependent methyltransferase
MSQPTLEEVPCNLCGSSRNQEVFNRPYKLDSAGDEGFAATTDEFQNYGRIVRCRDCGLVFTSPRPSAKDLIEGYSGCADESYAVESSSRSINGHLSLSTIKRFIKNGKLLEVGASTGYFLNAARVDFDVAGLEPSQWACQMARDRFRLDCYQETLEATERFAPGSLDVVVMIDVIEHLTDPKAAIKRAAQLLRPGGLLYLVTPDIDSASAWVLRGSWWGFRPAHIYYFSVATMRRLLGEAGFDVVLSKSFGRIFTWNYWASRLRHYPFWVYRSVLWLIGVLGLERKFLYLDTRDSMEICAVKRP